MAYIIRGSNADQFIETYVEFTEGYEALQAFFDSTYARVDSSGRANWLSGTPFPPELVPTTARIVKGDAIYDWLTMLGGACMVSARLKACVEELDPGRHQFFPITVTDMHGAVKQGPFFIFNVVGYIDSIVEARSNLKPMGRGIIPSWSYTGRNGPWQCTLDRSVIGDRACWTELRYGRRWFASDRLAASLQQRDLLGFRLGEFCDEVSI